MPSTLTRRDVLRSAGLGFASLALSGKAAGARVLAESGASERPNIIIALCDDLGYGDLACYGHRHIQTPSLDRLADEGVRLTDCYAARSGLLTGPSRHAHRPDATPLRRL